MLIRLSDEVLNQTDLIEIIDYVKVCNGQHILCNKRVAEIVETLAGDTHYLNLYKELVVKSSQAMGFVNSIEVVKKDVSSSDQILVGDLYSLLRKPAILILENEHSDRKFIETILHCLNARRLIESLDDFWEIRGAGGSGQIVKLVEKYIAVNVNSSRVSVVHDSDKLSPQSDMPKMPKSIIKYCRDKNVKCKTLEKREIENYIVDEVIAELQFISNDAKNSFYALTAEQKDHYDFKKGLNKKNIADYAYSPQMYSFYTHDALNRRDHHIIPEFKEIINNIHSML